MPNKPNLYLDKVERKLLAQIKDMKPEYADLELYQVAHLELKERIFAVIRENNKNKGKVPGLHNAPFLYFRLRFYILKKLLILSHRLHLLFKNW